MRQLNIYGFRKVPCEPGYAKFKHPEFRRGNLAGIIRMKRRVPKSAKKKGAARHEVDDVIKELVALKQRQRQVEVHVDQLTRANEQLVMDNQALWQQVHDSRERQARLQARMRKLLLILLNVFQARRGGPPQMLEGAGGPSNSLVVAQPHLQLQMPGHHAASAAASAVGASGSMRTSAASTPVGSTPVATSAGVAYTARAPHLHGAAPVHHPFYRAQGHLDPGQLHSAIHFLGIHHDDPSHPVHPSTGITVRVVAVLRACEAAWCSLWSVPVCVARCSTRRSTLGFTRRCISPCRKASPKRNIPHNSCNRLRSASAPARQPDRNGRRTL